MTDTKTDDLGAAIMASISALRPDVFERGNAKAAAEVLMTMATCMGGLIAVLGGRVGRENAAGAARIAVQRMLKEAHLIDAMGRDHVAHFFDGGRA